MSAAREIFLSEFAPVCDAIQALKEKGEPVPEELRQKLDAARDRYNAALDAEGRITVVRR